MQKERKPEEAAPFDSAAYEMVRMQARIDSIESSIRYQTGKITLRNNLFSLNVPQGFKFVDAVQGQYILEDLFGNPPDKEILGLIFPSERGVFTGNSYFFAVTYSDMGHVDDGDAEDTDYDELLAELKKDVSEANPERVRNGYPACEMLRWASQPYYDGDKKVLHWAKEIKFGDDSVNTLNYDVRVLGKSGVLILQAIASIGQLPAVKENINNIYNMVEFGEGNKYSNFDPDVDKLAAVGIGGLIAGKVLAKVGFFALLLKFWKFIAIACVAAFAGIRNFLKRKNSVPPPSPGSENLPG